MARTPPESPFVVTQRVEVTLSAAELEHAIRCWMLDKPVPQADQFSDVAVRVFATEEGFAMSAVLSYHPTTRPVVA